MKTLKIIKSGTKVSLYSCTSCQQPYDHVHLFKSSIDGIFRCMHGGEIDPVDIAQLVLMGLLIKSDSGNLFKDQPYHIVEI